MTTRWFQILSMMLLPSGAAAQWSVQQSDEDVFGNINVTVDGAGDNGGSIRFECGSSNEPFLAYLIRDSSGDIPDFPAEFIHVDQNGERHSSPATLRAWNENYVGVVIEDFAMLRGVAEHMIVAQGTIPIGVDIPVLDMRVSDTFVPYGSTAAGKAILEHCVPQADADGLGDTGSAQPEAAAQ